MDGIHSPMGSSNWAGLSNSDFSVYTVKICFACLNMLFWAMFIQPHLAAAQLSVERPAEEISTKLIGWVGTL